MYPTRILVTMVSLIAVGATTVVALVITDNVDAASTPIIVTVLGFIGLVVNNLVTGAKTDAKVDEVHEKVDQVLNGTMDDKIRTVVRSELTATVPRFRSLIRKELHEILDDHLK